MTFNIPTIVNSEGIEEYYENQNAGQLFPFLDQRCKMSTYFEIF